MGGNAFGWAYPGQYYAGTTSTTFNQALTATSVTVTASMVRSVAKAVTATATTVSASVVKQITKSLSATATASASIVADLVAGATAKLRMLMGFGQ